VTVTAEGLEQEAIVIRASVAIEPVASGSR